MNEERPSAIRHLDEQCRSVNTEGEAAFVEQSNADETTLRSIDSKWGTLVQLHCNTKKGPSIGTAEDGKVRTVGSWSLKYQDDTSSWIGENKQFEVQVFWNTSVNDLKTLLTSFDRVSKESRAMEQPRFFLMRIGFPSDFPPSTENAIARTYADRGIINWQATRQGLLPAAAFEDTRAPSTLDHIVYHEATHLMEPEMKESLGDITKLISQNKSAQWVGGDLKVNLPPEAQRAVTGINPEYLPLKLHFWKMAASGLHYQHSTGTLSDEDFKNQSHDNDEDLAVEILVETTCSLFWKSANVPFPRGEWADLDKIADSTVEKMQHLYSMSAEDRESSYKRSAWKNQERDTVRVFILPGRSSEAPAKPSHGPPRSLAGIGD